MHAVARRFLSHAEILTAMGLVLVASWAFVAWMTLGTSHPAVSLMMPIDAAWSLATAFAVFVMWAGMMVAMMLPAAAPMILTFDALESRNARSGAARSMVFAGAYLLVWIVFSALATGVQWGLQHSGMLTPMMESGPEELTAALLILAGLYQLTPLKHACLKRCRTPVGFLMAEWRDGPCGALRMGLKHGVYCTGCCWALMLLLFVAGVMNPIWIICLTTVVALEKWPRLPRWITTLLAGILLLAGAVRLL